MTVLQQVQLASSVIGISYPSVVFSGTDTTSIAIQSCMQRVAQMIAYDADYEWTGMKGFATIPGDGVNTKFAFPADYKRMLKVAQLWSSKTPMTPIPHYQDTNEWLGLIVQAFLPVFGAWTILGNKINVIPVRPVGETLTYPYITTTPVADGAGSPKVAFTLDSDTFPLGERVLQLGFIYLWKQDKGQDYGEAMEDYHTALAVAIGNDKGSRKLIAGKRRMPGNTAANAFPRSLGT